MKWFGRGKRQRIEAALAPGAVRTLAITDAAKLLPAATSLLHTSVPAAYAAVSLLASLLAGLTPQIVSDDGDPRPDHPINALLRRSTRRWPARLFWEHMYRTMLTDGWAAAYIRRQYGEIVELIPCLSGSTANWRDSPPEPSYDLTLYNGAILSQQPRDRVLVIAGDGYDGLCAPSPIAQHATTLGVLSNAATHMAQTLRRGMHIGGVVESDTEVGQGMNWDLPRIAQLRQKLVELFSGLGNAGSVPVLPPGFNFKAVPFSAVDIQLIEVLQLGIEDICRIYRVPPRLLYQYRRGTRFGGAVEESNTEIVQYSITPRAQSISAQLTAQLLNDSTSTDRIWLDPEQLASGSIASRVATVDQAVARAGMLTINESRHYVDTGRLPRLRDVPDGDRLLDPKGAPAQPRTNGDMDGV